jgi:hypothetical protein
LKWMTKTSSAGFDALISVIAEASTPARLLLLRMLVDDQPHRYRNVLVLENSDFLADVILINAEGFLGEVVHQVSEDSLREPKIQQRSGSQKTADRYVGAAKDCDVDGRSDFIGQPQRRLFLAILEQSIRRHRVAHQKADSVSNRRSLQRKIAQIPSLFIVEHGTRIAPSFVRHGTKARRASWVFIEAYPVVVISANDYRRLFAYEVDDLRGIWPVVHHVAQPQS